MDQGKGPKGGHGGFAFAQAKIFRQGGPKLARKLAEWRIDVDIVGQVARPPRRTGAVRGRHGPLPLRVPATEGASRTSGPRSPGSASVFAPVARQGIRYLDLNEHLCSAVPVPRARSTGSTPTTTTPTSPPRCRGGWRRSSGPPSTDVAPTPRPRWRDGGDGGED